MKRCLGCDAVHDSRHSACEACGFRPVRLGGFVAHAPELAREGGGYDADLFATMAGLEAGSFWFVSRNDLITWAIAEHQPEPETMLEIGCGTGFVLSAIACRFPSASLYGSEIFVDGLGYARTRVPGAELMQMDARDIPYQGEFDVLGAFDVLEHIEEDTDVLTQMHGALRPGGLLVVTVPQHAWLWSAADDHAHHVRRYTATDLESKVAGAGFEVLRSTSFVSVLLPGMVASRLLSRRSGQEYDPAREMRLPGVLNTLMGSAMAVERRLIRAGVNFRWGGSRLVVARRLPP